MSASTYRRATKKYAARVDHIDGDVSTGFLLVPVGIDFVTTITQNDGFLHFQTEGGEETYLNMSAIKRITELVEQNARQREEENQARKAAEEKAKAQAEKEARKKREQDAARRQDGASKSPFTCNEEYAALDVMGVGESITREELQSAYRRLVKLYHPDRLRGLGVSEKKIAYAAERLSEINNAYKVLAKNPKVA